MLRRSSVDSTFRLRFFRTSRSRTVVATAMLMLFTLAQMTSGQVAKTETRERDLKSLFPSELKLTGDYATGLFYGFLQPEELSPAPTQTPTPPNENVENVEPSPLPGTSESPAPLPIPNNVEPELPVPASQIGSSEQGEPEVEVNLKQKNKLLKFVFGVQVRGGFDDNIFIQSHNPQSDFVFTLSPTIAIGWGEVREEVRRLAGDVFGRGQVGEGIRQLPGDLSAVYWEPEEEVRNFLFLQYTPTLTLFAEHGSQNALDHYLSLQGQLKLAYLTLGNVTTFLTLSGPDVDLGRRVNRSIFSERIDATYDYSDRTFFAVNLLGTFRTYEVGFNSNEFVNEDSINYRYGARTLFSLATRFGYLQVEDNPDQVYEQCLLGTRYLLSDKFTVNGNAGIEFRQVQSGGQDTINPVFQLGVGYKPFDQTLISLKASRLTTNSESNAGQNITYSSIGLAFEQRFFKRYYLSLYTGYVNADYSADFSGNNARRTDNIISVSPSVRVELTKNSSLQISYELWRDSSTVADRSFTVNRVFTQFGLLF